MLHPSHSQYEPQNMYCRGKGVWVGGVTHFENSEVSMVALITTTFRSGRSEASRPTSEVYENERCMTPFGLTSPYVNGTALSGTNNTQDISQHDSSL